MWKRRIVLLFGLSFCAAVPAGRAAQPEDRFDLLIVGGRILDGTGNPWRYADVGVRDGRIVAVARNLRGRTASRVIEADGLTVAPGFVDLHSHAYDDFRPGRDLPSEPERRRGAPNLVAQGVTTLVTNQDGRGGWTIAKQRELLEAGGVGPNVILLVGHGVVRSLAMGDDFRRLAAAEEISRMRELLRQGMREGAFGMSAGLEYVPGRWSDTEEMVALAEELVPFGGVLVEHERGSGEDPMWYLPSQHPPGQPGILQSVAESVEIAERSGATVVCTHLKAKGARFWGSGRAVVNLIATARRRGVSIWGDSYPYNTTGSDGRTVLIPAWAGGEDPREALREVLNDEDLTAKLRLDIAHEINRRGGADHLVLMEYPDRSLVGKTLAEVAQSRRISDVDAALALALEGFSDRRGGARMRGFSLSEIDVEIFAAQPWTATASDAGIALPGDGFVHARYYGTFPRKIRRYAMERGMLSVADAVRTMTSLPARILGLRDRGMIREGLAADLVVMDLRKIRDTATFFEPHQYPDGVEYVFVNGGAVVDGGRLTGALPGKVLTRDSR